MARPRHAFFPLAMLSILRPSGSAPTLRRVIAALLVLVMGVACAEPLLADSCDGDAPRAVASAVVPHVDGQTVVTGVATVAAAVVGAADASDDPTDGDRVPEHTVHVCHCTHAHGGTLSGRYALHARLHPVARAIDARSDRLPPSPAREPQFRPPVLPHTA